MCSATSLAHGFDMKTMLIAAQSVLARSTLALSSATGSI